MTIGEPQRVHEIVPVTIPVPEREPSEPEVPVPVGPDGEPLEEEE